MVASTPSLPGVTVSDCNALRLIGSPAPPVNAHQFAVEYLSGQGVKHRFRVVAFLQP